MSRASGTDIVRGAVLIAAALLFTLPILASAAFGFSRPDQGLTFAPLIEALTDADFVPLLGRSITLAILTTVGSFALFIPTLLWLRLRVPRALPIAEALSVLPMVVPAVALVNGANLAFRSTVPGFLTSVYSLVPFYMALSMPLVYRSLDAGMRSIDLRTLFDASTSLGSSPLGTVRIVILPNMRPALITSAMLSTTLALGEFALAQLLLHPTYPVFLAQLGRNQPRPAAALAFLTILGTWLLLVFFVRTKKGQLDQVPSPIPVPSEPEIERTGP